MRALVCRALGDPTIPLSSQASPLFIDEEHPRPPLVWPDDVRVRVRAVSLNYATLLSIKGSYQEKHKLPFVPGSDFCGIVEEVGSEVSLVRIGDAVCGLGDIGSFAEEHVISESKLWVCLLFFWIFHTLKYHNFFVFFSWFKFIYSLFLYSICFLCICLVTIEFKVLVLFS